uniref:Uncharacterized protein n=1 Tax=Fagus sylvatica TaxID=28930 RepID=A0A2N9IPZ8_FAGSY
MWRSKDHRSAGLWWSLLSSGGGHGRLSSLFSLGYDFCFSWCCRGPFCDEVHRDLWPLPHLPRHPLRHLSQLAPPQIAFVTEFGCEPLDFVQIGIEESLLK